MTDGKTKLVGLIGWPVEHSLSPAMHNAAFEALGLNWHYVPLPVPPGLVHTAVRGLAALGFRGANVTVPHKQAVIHAVDSVDAEAQVLGAVNTIIIDRYSNGSMTSTGYNTDHEGFVGALREAGFEPAKDKRAVVIGAGGSSRAVAFGLLWSGIREILVLNRTFERAQALVDLLQTQSNSATQMRALELTSTSLIESARSTDLLINATSVGMWPQVERSIWPDNVPLPSHLTVFDLVYNPLQTRLLQQAGQSGANPIDGLGMLVRQGAIAFAKWTKHSPISEIAALMRTACAQVIENRKNGVDKPAEM